MEKKYIAPQVEITQLSMAALMSGGSPGTPSAGVDPDPSKEVPAGEIEAKKFDDEFDEEELMNPKNAWTDGLW